METRYLVLACKNQASRFYRTGEKLADTRDRAEADRYFLHSPKAPNEMIVMFVFDSASLLGREIGSRI